MDEAAIADLAQEFGLESRHLRSVMGKPWFQVPLVTECGDRLSAARWSITIARPSQSAPGRPGA
jgi:hypothetical protein